MKIDSKKEEIFVRIFDSNHWGDGDSKSGPGSNIRQTEVLRGILPPFLLRHGVKSILDIPCGDFFWMKEIKAELSASIDEYRGGDIVNVIIQKNNNLFGDSKFSFHLLDITVSDLPKVDLIFCRDCLVHFSYEDIYKTLKNFKRSGAYFLLTTTFLNRERRNKNIRTGGWRPLNFRRFPFFFPEPVDVIVEQCTENNGIYRDKSLGLWKISNLNIIVFSLMLLIRKIAHGIKRIK